MAEIIFVNTSNDGIAIKNIAKTSANGLSKRIALFTEGPMPEWK